MTFFFYGPNSYELQQQVQKMVAAYVKKSGSDMGVERIDGATSSLNALVAGVQAAPFLANSRLVIIHGLLANKAVAAQAGRILEAVPASTVAVFAEREADQRTVAFKALKAADKVVKFEPLTGPKLLGWVAAQAKAVGGSIEPAVARRLVDQAGEDQWRLSGEIQKLAAYAPAIEADAVDQLVVPSIERSIFDLVEAMTTGKVPQTMGSYQALLAQKESDIYILTMVQWQLRNLLLVKLAPSGMSPTEVAGAAGMSPYVASKAAAAQSRLSEVMLRQSYAQAVDTEYRIKSGFVKPEIGVEQLLLRIARAAQG